ncbi:hypothetical protein FRC01_009779 [Tulasnella sp. 417]|nr:hypothetical protein FRC01_009779 [Tulasnella sp. 417]
MVHRLSSIRLALGLAAFPVAINAICTSGVLCELNTRAGVHQRFWGTCVQHNVTISNIAQYVALAVEYVLAPSRSLEWSHQRKVLKWYLTIAFTGAYLTTGRTPYPCIEQQSTIQPAQGAFDFSTPDIFVKWWQRNAKSRLWIHTLLPTTGLPTWVTNSAWTKSQMISIIQDYVTTVATYYQGRVYAWDVVSEIFNDNGTWRDNVFYNYLGSDFVEIALWAARAADPNAKLYIEEYGAEDLNVKSDALYYLAQTLKNNGVPLDGIGFEGHAITPTIPPPAGIMPNTQRFEALDLDWAYTQIGVRIVNGSSSPGRQAEDYHAMLISCMNSRRCVGVLTSGITDLTTIEGMGIWGGPQWTETLFDAYYVPVIGYNVIANYLSTVTVDGAYI